jgi:hypothetical protein
MMRDERRSLCLADAAVDNKNQLILPVLSKFLVCSAFFASNNPARTDNKFFGRGKSRGHTRTVAGKVGQGKAGREVCLTQASRRFSADAVPQTAVPSKLH